MPYTFVELDAIVEELGEWGPLARFAAATGLRPSEWVALERRDIRKDEGVVIVERSFAYRKLKSYGKTDRSRRRVPLSERALEAYSSLPARLDTRLVFPAVKGGHIDLHNWRGREFNPAVEASGVGHGYPYTLRHTYATNMLASGTQVFDLARFMGTSVDMIDRRYGHLAQGSERAATDRMGAYERSCRERAEDSEPESQGRPRNPRVSRPFR